MLDRAKRKNLPKGFGVLTKMSAAQDPFLHSDESEPNEDQRKELCRRYLAAHLICTELYPGNQEELELVDDDEAPPAGPLPTRRRINFATKRPRGDPVEDIAARKSTGKAPYRPPEPEDDIPDLGDYFAGFPDLSELDQVKLCRAYANYLSAKDARNRIRYTNSGASWKSKQKDY